MAPAALPPHCALPALEHADITGSRDHDHPYTAGDGFGGNACWEAASGRRVAAIDGYRAIAKNSTSALLAALRRGPVSVAVDSTVWQSYKSGTIASGCGTALDHAVLLVGATDEYLVVKNSWGLAWGLAGYVHLAIDDTKQHGLALVERRRLPQLLSRGLQEARQG